MITYKEIARRFQGGASVEELARMIPYTQRRSIKNVNGVDCDAYDYVEHAIRQVMMRQDGR